MANTRQLIEIALDQAASRIVEKVGDLFAPPQRQMVIYYGTQVLFHADIFTHEPAAQFSPDPAATWLFGVDDEPFSSEPDYVISENEQFNISGDRPGQDTAGGQICWRASFDTIELKTALERPSLAARVTVPMYACLWMRTAAGNALIAQWQLQIGKVFIDPTTARPVEGITHASLSAVEAIASNITAPDGGLYRLKNGALQLWNADQSKWHGLAIAGAAGQEHLIIGAGEE